MDTPNDNFNRILKWKQSGGVQLEVFVSDGIYLGGLLGSQSHARMVAVAPDDWDGEEAVAFFTDREQVDAFIEKLRQASSAAFGGED